MGWIWIDDLMPENRKVLKAGPLASWLFICGLAYCNRNNSGGLIPKAVVPRLADVPKRTTQRLVDAGLWHDEGDEYAVHDYDHYQLSKAEREKRREAGREGARRRWGNSTPHSESDSTSHSGRSGTPHESAMATPPPTPTPTPKPTNRRSTADGPVRVGEALRSAGLRGAA